MHFLLISEKQLTHEIKRDGITSFRGIHAQIKQQCCACNYLSNSSCPRGHLYVIVYSETNFNISWHQLFPLQEVSSFFGCLYSVVQFYDLWCCFSIAVNLSRDICHQWRFSWWQSLSVCTTLAMHLITVVPSCSFKSCMWKLCNINLRGSPNINIQPLALSLRLEFRFRII